jgi:SAM-dependent methyltransferase
LVAVLLGSALTLGGAYLSGQAALPHYRAGLQTAAAAGVALLVLVSAAALWRRPFGALLTDTNEANPDRVALNPRLTLFIASFVALFVELALIRYTSSQLRVFSFFKNVPLIASYLGLGLGCALGGGRPRHVLLLLLWLVPLAIFLAEGAFLVAGTLSLVAALATSEHLLGDAVVRTSSDMASIAGQVGMGVFCLVTLFAVASLFAPLGRLLGDAFDRLPRLTAYTTNILGSLAGTGMFILFGYFWTPPWLWFLIGLAPLLWWFPGRRHGLVGAGLIALSALAVAPTIGHTIWSPYQKLVGQPVELKPNPSAPALNGYLVDISDVFYQVAVDLRPAAIAEIGKNPYPHYDAAFDGLSRPIGRVLIVGPGTGNDVAAALRAGAAAVDAVDIDPAIVALGRQHHPEQPYADPRVRVIVDDARAAFKLMPAGAYDAVLFGLLDSHTQLGMSSVRLDNYVFTRQSFDEARRLLKPGGRIVVTAATFRDWFRDRFVRMLEATCGTPVRTRETGSVWITYDCAPDQPSRPLVSATTAADATLPTDDWPFLYLPSRIVPRAYLLVVAILALGSVLVVRGHGLSPKRFSAYHGHLFCLGAAFLLMEVYAINRLALLFGTTWVVSAIAIVVVLMLIVAANFTVHLLGQLPHVVAYVGLLVSLLVSYLLSPEIALGRGLGFSVGYGFAALLPVYFAGVIFARSFTMAPTAGPAIGANMLGAVVGGWAEYSSMALGIRALVLLAMAFYISSWICLRVWKREPRAVLFSSPSQAGGDKSGTAYPAQTPRIS